jgi:hypothetical protein
MLSRIARCPECGNSALGVQPCRDPIERLFRHPLSYLQKFLAAPLLYCPFCRLQFYDSRPLEQPARQPAREKADAAAAGGSQTAA